MPLIGQERPRCRFAAGAGGLGSKLIRLVLVTEHNGGVQRRLPAGGCRVRNGWRSRKTRVSWVIDDKRQQARPVR